MVRHFSLLPQGRRYVHHILPWTGTLLHGSPAPKETEWKTLKHIYLSIHPLFGTMHTTSSSYA